MVKELHPVFRVLNFIASIESHSYNLSSDEKLLLIYLARHQDEKGIMPKTTTLAKELNRHRTTISRAVALLLGKNLLKVIHRKGRSSKYFISFLPETWTKSKKLSTTRSNVATTSYPQPVALLHRGRSNSATTIYSINTEINNTERGVVAERDNPGSLSLFLFDEEMLQLAKEKKLNLNNELLNMRYHAQAKGVVYKDERAAFRLWLSRAREVVATRSSSATTRSVSATTHVPEKATTYAHLPRGTMPEKVKKEFEQLRVKMIKDGSNATTNDKKVLDGL